MDNKVIFQNSTNAIFLQSLYFIGGYVTYEIAVSTGSFSGACNFCIDETKIEDYIATINKMINTLNGNIHICDCESDSYLKFYFCDSLNFYITGQIGGSHEDNILKFKFKADQSLLLRLKNNLLNY